MGPAYECLYDSYFPFRLYADFKRGVTLEALAEEYWMPLPWIEERIEAARLCIEKQIRIDLSAPEEA